MQIAFCTKCSVAAVGDIGFGIEHETDGAFAIGFGKTRVGALETSGEVTVGDETTDLLWIPFAGWIEAINNVVQKVTVENTGGLDIRHDNDKN